MKLRSQFWLVSLILAWSILSLSACGGGGGGGDDGPTIPSTYTGLTTQAVITDSNAVDIVSGAFEGGMPAENIGDILPLSMQQSNAGLQIPLLLKNLAAQISVGNSTAITPLTIISDSMTGDCGGSASYSIDVNDSTGTFTGSMTFDYYCSTGTTINGTVPLSGKATDTSFTLNFQFNNLSITADSVSQTLTSGTAKFVFYETSATETLNYVLIDNTTQDSFWINNYNVNIILGSSDTLTMTGRYYHPDYGFVVISTLTPLTVPDTVLPTGGQLLFTGSGSKARLTFNSDQSTLLELDANNDGTYETSIDNPI